MAGNNHKLCYVNDREYKEFLKYLFESKAII